MRQFPPRGRRGETKRPMPVPNPEYYVSPCCVTTYALLGRPVPRSARLCLMAGSQFPVPEQDVSPCYIRTYALAGAWKIGDDHLAVKNFTHVSVSAKMRLTSISALKKPSKEASNAIKFYENGHQKYEKGVRFCVTHLNILAAHPLWRYRKRGFGVLGGPKRANNRVRRDVSVSAKMRLTSKAQRQFQSLPADPSWRVQSSKWTAKRHKGNTARCWGRGG